MDRLGFRLQGTSWDGLFDRLRALGNCGAILGPHGHGKTTFLDAFEAEFVARGHRVQRFFLNDASPRLPDMLQFADDEVVILDGAERLSWPLWRRFLWHARHARGIVITVHAGRRLPVLFTCTTSLPLMDNLLRELWPEAPAHVRDDARDLFHRHDGNLRSVFRALYDCCGGMPRGWEQAPIMRGTTIFGDDPETFSQFKA